MLGYEVLLKFSFDATTSSTNDYIFLIKVGSKTYEKALMFQGWKLTKFIFDQSIKHQHLALC